MNTHDIEIQKHNWHTNGQHQIKSNAFLSLIRQCANVKVYIEK